MSDMNYPTELVTLWMDNDQTVYAESRQMARETHAEWLAEGGRGSEGTLADRLRDEAYAVMPDLEGIWADLLGSAFGEVDWHAIAASILDEVRANA